MELINSIRVENFRSIRSIEIKAAGDYNPIVGLNSSGKSNLLRALNLFFNNIIDPESLALILGRDLSDYAPTGKKKYVSVGVIFNLSSNFKVRNQDDFLKSHELSTTIAINRTWTLDSQGQSLTDSYSFGPDFSTLKPAEPGEVPNLLLFIRAVQFRYIPNHARPADLIRQYAEPFRTELMKRVQGTQEYRQGAVAELMNALSRTGEQMFADVSKSVGSGITNLSVNPTLPRDFAELAFDVALQSVSNGKARAPELEGSGAQSFILLHILNLVDRVSRGRAFGWVQASIWAIEEPESFLHSGLRSRFAADLARYADDERRQIFATTHQDEFVRVATQAWLVSHGSTGSRVDRLAAKEVLARSARMAITSYRHPLLEYPDIPIVIVEGRFDEVYLTVAIREAGIRPRWRILSPDQSFGDGTAGDALKSYLKYNQAALQARPLAAPILVLRDWEAKDTGAYKKLLEPHPYSNAVTTPENLCNPQLGRSFVGIERYLSTEIILAHIAAKELLKPASGEEVYEVNKPAFIAKKRAISDSVQDGRTAGPYLVDLVKWLDSAVETLLDKVPPGEFAL